jgi:hypothetical protein
MKIIPKIFALVFCLLILFACQKKEAPRTVSAPAPMAALSPDLKQNPVQENNQTPDKAQKDFKTDPTKRKIIKEGELIFETRDIDKTRALINKSVNEVQGYFAEENQEKFDDRLETRAVIRVPAENFDKLLETLSSSAEVVDRKTIKALDVTEEYVDLEARLKTRKDIENRYRQLLGQAKKVDDILNIEKQMGVVREEIEAAEGRLKYYNDRIAFSTLTVVYYERKGSPLGFTSKFIHGLRSGWENLALFVVFLANIWPFIVLAIVAIYLFKKIRKRLAAKKNK